MDLRRATRKAVRALWLLGLAVAFRGSGGHHPEPAEAGESDPLLASLADESKRLSTALYTRSGVYLIIGVLVAFSGLGFFYLQTLSLPDGDSLLSPILGACS